MESWSDAIAMPRRNFVRSFALALSFRSNLFRNWALIPALKKDCHENVAPRLAGQATFVQAGCLRYIFIMRGCPNGDDNSE
jgi:hypothetical protein